MRRTGIHIYTLALILITGASACEKNIDIDIDEITPMIVLNSLIETDSSVSVSLSRTRHILDNKEITNLSNGIVKIFNTQGDSADLSWDGQRNYVSDNFQISDGEQYTITASAPGYFDVEASCVMPERIPIKRLDTATVYNEWNDEMLSLGIVFEDDPDVDNYYQLTLGSKYYYREWYIEESYDTLYYDPVQDTVIMGYRYDTIENLIPEYTREYFNTEDLIVEEWDYNGGVVFTDRLIQGKEYSLKGTIYTGYMYYSADTSTLYVNLHSISKDYFEYVSSLEKHYNAKEDPFSTPVVVHGNVENGLGIFGGRVTSRDSLRLAPVIWKDPYWEYY